ncbi:MAG: HIT domain-containing protein [Alphaproteobacteria bacterium]
MTYDNNNVFAKMLRKEIPVDFIYENDYALAFYDINPQKKLHILIIPKGAYSDIYDFTKNASAEEQLGLNQAIVDIVEDKGMAEEGFRLISNCKGYGGQEVPHLHFHLLGGENVGPLLASSAS